LDINNEIPLWTLWELWTILNLSKFMAHMQLVFILFNHRKGHKSSICSYVPIHMLPDFAALDSCQNFQLFCLGA
jgi:hypothetical protein